jgi:stage II sporulation protein GA (sporulation sigma-E factor processing peptidase)
LRVLYIDVYFFINFTVDILALYFAARLIHKNPSALRLVFGGIIGSAFAVLCVMLGLSGVWYFALLFSSLLCLAFVSVSNVSIYRRIKFAAAFLIIETLLGGIVSAVYSYFDIYVYPLLGGFEEKVENKRILVFSVAVLIGITLITLVFSLFGNMASEKCAVITTNILGINLKLDALVDNGNRLKDPMDNSAVTIVKAKALWKKFEGKDFSSILEQIGPEYKTKIRLIPVNSFGAERLLVGIRGEIKIKIRKKEETVNTVIAIDEEEGSFAGYSAIIPASLI